MPVPTTIDEFLEVVRRSDLVGGPSLDRFLAEAGSSMPDQPATLAGALVEAGIVTRFQAEQFLLGKWQGFTLGKYRVLERLGSGGMGNVYLCEHRYMRRLVAVKVPFSRLAEDPAIRERFFREVRAAGLLDHPNIIRVYDVQQEGPLIFLVMEYVDGSTLRQIVAGLGPMDIRRAAHYVRQAALGMQHIHQAGIVHRDVKPSNLLLSRTGVVKLFDLGLARFAESDSGVLTHHEIALGTEDYIAPEQARDSHSAATTADIYSLGVTFYYLLTGRTPFQEGTSEEKLLWQQARQPPPLRSLRPEVPEELAVVVDRMMAKDPSQRYATAAAVAEALTPCTQIAIPPPPEAEMPRVSPAVRSLAKRTPTL